MRNYYMTVVMAVDKRCAASAASRVCSERNTTWENTFAENFAITNKSMNKRRFAVMNSLQVLLFTYPCKRVLKKLVKN